MKKQQTTLRQISGVLFSLLILISILTCNSNNSERDYFKELNVKSFINAGLPYSTLSGAEMWPEVIEAVKYASTHRARMKELHDAVGENIASLIGCEAAMVSAGASSAITLGTAACMTGKDKDLIHQLPDARGMKYEVIIQKSHRYTYEQAVRICGAKLFEIETVEELEQAVNNRTTMMLFYYGRNPKGQIKVKEFIEIGKKHNVPVFLDGATTVPPASNLKNIMDLGCDLASFSGGKGLQGPFSAGLLLGRKDLIEAARLNSSPNDGTIGRGMKVSKEEYLGMMVAVEVSLKRDYKSDVEKGKRWMQQIADKLTEIPSLKTNIFVPEHADQMPRLALKWNSDTLSLTSIELIKQLRVGNPSIEVVSFGQTNGEFHISSWMLKQEEVEIVGNRLLEELKKTIK